MGTNMTSQFDQRVRPDVVVSIPYSGTHFLKHHFGGHCIHATGCWSSLMMRLQRKKPDAHIYVPVRRPEHVWTSWTRRKENPDIAHFMSGWYNLHALSLVRYVDFIDIDARDDPRISDWTPRGNLKHYPYEARELPTRFRNVLHCIPFVQERYGLPIEPDELGHSE